MKKQFLLVLCVCGIVVLHEVVIIAQQQAKIQATIQQLTTHLNSMAEVAGNTADPVQAYHLLTQVTSLMTGAETLLNALDVSLEKNEQLADEFKQKAEEYRNEPQKAKMYEKQVANVLEQTDLLFMLKNDLADAMEVLRKQTERLKANPIVQQLLDVDTGAYEQEIRQTVEKVKSAAESASNSDKFLPEWETLAIESRKLSEALDQKIKQNEQSAAEFKKKADEVSSESEKAQLYTQSSSKLLDQTDRLFVMKHKLDSATESLEKQIERIKKAN